ncbi:MAG TPA: hypothetical protein ENN09_06915, partial [Planctomycetes bacterium]|nr:hypothetical protein [Planctomycetota bacterium]
MERQQAALGAAAATVLFCAVCGAAERGDLTGYIRERSKPGDTVYVEVGGRSVRAALVKADEEGIAASLMGMEIPQNWYDIGDRQLLLMARRLAGDEDGEALLLLYRFAIRREELKDEAVKLEGTLKERFPERFDAPKHQESVKPAASEEKPPGDEIQGDIPVLPVAAAGGTTPGPFLKAPRGTYEGIFRGHPKIFVRDGDREPGFGISLGELRRRARTAPWSAFTGRLREAPEEPVHYSAPNLAMSWLATGNESAARRAIEIIKQPIRMDGTTYMGDHLEAVCIAYDWLYNYPGFSEEDKRAVRESILRSAEQMRRIMHDHAWHTRPYAWANGVMFAGLALYPEEPRAEALARAAVEQYKRYLIPARQMHDGAWQNSMAYGRKYMVRSVFHALSAWTSATGEDLWYHAAVDGNWTERMLYMLIYACRPDYSYVTYGDFYQSGWTAETKSYNNLLSGTYGTRNPYGQG